MFCAYFTQEKPSLITQKRNDTECSKAIHFNNIMCIYTENVKRDSVNKILVKNSYFARKLLMSVFHQCEL